MVLLVLTVQKRWKGVSAMSEELAAKEGRPQQAAWRTYLGDKIPDWIFMVVTRGGLVYVVVSPFFGQSFWRSLLLWLGAFLASGLLVAVLAPLDKVGSERRAREIAEKAAKKAEEARKAEETQTAGEVKHLRPGSEGSTTVELRKHLMDGEKIEGHISITFKPRGHTVAKSGIAVATDRRVLTVYKGMMGGSSIEQFPYDKISSVEFRTILLSGNLIIRSADNEMDVTLDKEGGREFSKVLNEVMARYKGSGNSAPINTGSGSADLVAQLERLATLHKQGLLGEEEYQTAKDRLLAADRQSG